MKKSTILEPPGQGWHGQLGNQLSVISEQLPVISEQLPVEGKIIYDMIWLWVFGGIDFWAGWRQVW